MASPDKFSMGISSEDKLSMPLDDLIRNSKRGGAGKTTTTGKLKVKGRAPRVGGNAHKHQNVKKTVSVPISKAARAKAALAVSSSKRQTMMNKHRAGLVVPVPGNHGKKTISVQLRSRKTSALRATQRLPPVGGRATTKYRQPYQSGGLDVSNIVRHFRTHPTKFNVPKGANLRITIDLHAVKPVVGTKK